MLPRSNGLLLKLAAFFLACGIPVLFAVDAARATFEFQRIRSVLDSSAIRAEIAREARAIARHRRERGLVGIGLMRDLERWLLTLSQPARSPFGDAAFALLEYGAQPFAAMLVDADNRVIAATRENLEIPTVFPPAASDGVQALAVDAPRLRRIYRVRLTGLDDQEEALLLWVELPRPGTRLLQALSFEWPILLAGAAVFALVAAVFLSAWVTRRLRRIAATADAWRHGHFELRIDDSASDEIGALAQQLDTIPAALAELVAHRSQRAGLHERERIARDLHDTIKQQAFALSMQLGALRAALPQPQRELAALREARSLADQIQRELAELLDELRPLQPGDWRARVVARIEDWARRCNIATTIELDDVELVAVSRQDLLMRVIDETLANIARHSGATHATVALTYAGQHFTLLVGDDGRGGIVEGQGRGLGNLRERAATLPDGRLLVRNEAAGGSCIELHWTETIT